MACFNLKISLALGSWSGCFSRVHCMENALTGYYLLAIDAMQQYGQRRSCDTFLSRLTTRNVLMAAANLVERCGRIESGSTFCPHCCQEDACEHHFGKIKGGSAKNGTSVFSLKVALLTTQRIHLLQQREPLDNLKDKKGETVPDMTGDQRNEEIAEVAEQAWRAAFLFTEAVTGQRVSDLEAKFAKWWDLFGSSLLAQPSSIAED